VVGPGSSRRGRPEGSGVRGLYVLPCDASVLPSPRSPDSQLSSIHRTPTATPLCSTLIPFPSSLLALGFERICHNDASNDDGGFRALRMLLGAQDGGSLAAFHLLRAIVSLGLAGHEELAQEGCLRRSRFRIG
jgi:hypothetical protein